MSQTYYATLTAVGEAKLANAAILGIPLELTHMAVGDGNGATPQPSRTQTALVHENRRAPLNRLSIDPANDSQIIAEQIIPENIGGWWIREIGLYDEDGNLCAVANCPDTYKPVLSSGSGRTQIIRMVLIVANTSAVELKVDPSVVLAPRGYVEQVMADHLSAGDPHPQYMTQTETSSLVEGVAVKYVDAITLVDARTLPDGITIMAKGRNTVGDGGGGVFRYSASSLQPADGVVVFAAAAGPGRFFRDGWTVFGFNGSLRFRWAGAVGDGVANDRPAINATFAVISAFGGGKVAGDIGVYGVDATIRIPSRTHFEGIGDKCQFKWIGAAPAAGSKTPVISVATIDPVNTAVSDVVVDSFSINCNNTPNLVGAEFVYASVMSRGVKIRVDDVGENGAGFRFAKLWYTNFDTLSVRCAVKNAGSIGFWFDTGSIATGEINCIEFRNLQSNRASIGMLLDSTNYLYANKFSGVFEYCDVGIRHIGKKGVRQCKFSGIYLESNTIQVDWQRDPAATDSSQQVMWENIQTQIGSSIWNIAEGRHWIRGCDRITTLNNSGAQIRVEGDAGISVVNSGAGRTLVQQSPTYLPQGNVYSSVYIKPQAVATSRNVLGASTTSITIPLPADLLNTAFPMYGREVSLKIIGRKISGFQSKLWEGYLVQRDNQTFGLAKSSYSSADDSTWSVGVDSATGMLTVTWNDTAEAKVITATYLPL